MGRLGRRIGPNVALILALLCLAHGRHLGPREEGEEQGGWINHPFTATAQQPLGYLVDNPNDASEPVINAQPKYIALRSLLADDINGKNAQQVLGRKHLTAYNVYNAYVGAWRAADGGTAASVWRACVAMATELGLSARHAWLDAHTWSPAVVCVLVRAGRGPAPSSPALAVAGPLPLSAPPARGFRAAPFVGQEALLLSLRSPVAPPWWQAPYMPYVMAAAAAALLLSGLAAVAVWCCVRRRGGKEAARREICLYPAAKPDVHNATLIQPSLSHLLSQRPAAGSLSPPTGYSTPNTYSSSSQSGTPLSGCTPVHTPPMRVRRGLLERRGSNASLTLELGAPAPGQDTKWGSPPKESSAEEYLLSASHRMSRKELRNCLKNVKALYEEFWEIPMNHPDKVEVAGSGMKNRYRTIIPNEATRVKLTELDRDPLTSYINANYIRGYGGEPRAYIATQGPMSNTVTDFWRMVYQERAPVIVMITKLKEKNRTKCESYLPERYGAYGDLEVFVHSIAERDGFILRNITIKCQEREHAVLHYWYTAWPDHKAPSTARQLLDLVTTVHAHRRPGHPGPVVVHCSAGIGRTGCFIGASVGVQQLRASGAVDVLALVCAMRLDRGGMVQTNEQYEFVHQALSLYEREIPEPRPAAAAAAAAAE